MCLGAVASRDATAEDASVVRTWMPTDGLPTSSVLDIAEARDGYLWVATTGGLARFDGVHFECFGLADGLPSTRFASLLVARDATLYALSDDGWLCHWDGRRFSGLDLHVSTGPGAMVETADGTIYVANAERLVRVRGRDVFVYRESPSWSATLVQDHDGALWISRGGSDPRTHTLTSAPARIEGDHIVSMTPPGPDGSVWLLDPRSGLARFFRPLGADAELLDTSLRRIALLKGAGADAVREIDADGRLWSSVGGDVVVRSIADGHELLQYTLGLTDRPWRVFRDAIGDVWVGTVRQGLQRIAPSPLRLLRPAVVDATKQIVWARERSDGQVYAIDYAFNAWRAGESELLPLPGGPYANGGDDTWEGEGPTRFRVGRNVLEIRGAGDVDAAIKILGITSEHMIIDPDHAASVYGLNAGGLHRYTATRDGMRDTIVFVPTQELRDLQVDRRHRLWVATAGGLWRLAPGDTACFTRLNGLPVDHVRQIHESADGTLWFGTYGAGLVRLKNGRFATLDHHQGLAEDFVSVVLEDDQGELWLAGNAGIQHFPRRQAEECLDRRRERVDAARLGREAGLLNPESSGQPGLRTRDGRLWFPTFGGLAVVDPRRARALVRVPPVPHIEGVLASERHLPRGPHGFVVPAGAGRIVVGYTGFDMRAADQLRFDYRLDGVDRDWVHAGAGRSASYTNVPPGRHVFHLAAFGELGRASTHEDAVVIDVRPQFWQTSWFFALGLAAFVAALVAGARIRDRRLRRQAEVLRHAVTERTAELAREKQRTEQVLETVVAQANRLEALDRARARFFAGVSHEFRTPLTLIRGPLEDVREGLHGDVPGDARQQLGLAIRNADRLGRLVDELLEAARAEAGQVVLVREPHDLVECLETLVRSFAPLADRSHIAFTQRLSAEPLVVLFDRGAIEKVVTNLLGNAFKYTPAGGHVELQAGIVAGGDPVTVEIRVIDDGPGIPAADLPHLFQAFYRSEQALTRGEPGTGLGLALASDLVELHAGTIHVESLESRGSTFVVRLPLPRAVAATERAAGEATHPVPAEFTALLEEIRVLPDDAGLLEAGAGPAEAADLRPLVLVVDDHADVRGYVARHLGRRYRVSQAADGVQALAAMRLETPDLVVSDVTMPELDGFGLVRALRDDPELDFVPVILLTAAASFDHRMQGLEGGADDYLTKPFEMRELLARISQALASRRKLRDRVARAAAEAVQARTTTAPPEPAAPSEVPSDDAAAPRNAADLAFVQNVREAIEAHMGDEDFEIERLVEAVGVGRSVFYERVGRLFEQPPRALVMHYRLERAAEMLRANEGNVGEVAYATGFRSISHFSRRFRDQFGATPSSYRRQA